MGRALAHPCPPVPERRTIPDLSVFEIAVVTPMFGGGVSAGQVDESMPIRTSSIRGHLRFWWRATCGAEYGSVQNLRERETEIWGAAERRSEVEVSVTLTDEGSEFPHDREPALKYVLFPFTTPGRTNVKFTLSVRCPGTYYPEVETALRAWVNFGGIGARTRRGCGALFCDRLAIRNADAARDVFRWNTPSHGWPVLRDVMISTTQRRPMEAWKDVIEIMRDFRQGTDGRIWNGRQPHRSRWPEPDSLRRITGEYQYGHGESETGASNAFPRGELGLPILFRFKKPSSEDARRGDDRRNNCELLPVNAHGEVLTRMASPVILRPLLTARDCGLPMVVILSTPGLGAARLKTGPTKNAPDPSPKLTNRDVPASEIRNAAAAAALGSPLAGTSGSALEAFLKYAREKL